MKGTISKLFDGRCGFITGKPKEVFFHHSAMEWGCFSQLEVGQVVEYDLYTSPPPLYVGYPGGPQAISVRPREEMQG